jgi:hypothetical protein
LTVLNFKIIHCRIDGRESCSVVPRDREFVWSLGKICFGLKTVVYVHTLTYMGSTRHNRLNFRLYPHERALLFVTRFFLTLIRVPSYPI